MAVGGCFCGKIRIEYNGQPLTTALCHCDDCRKLTGSPYTYNFVVKSADLVITGSPKEVPKTADSGNQIRNYFCPDCGLLPQLFCIRRRLLTNELGTPLFGWKVTLNTDGSCEADPQGVIVIRAGIFDDVGTLNEAKPVAEIYTDRRLKWVCPLEGAQQFGGNASA